jgi:hypothetical protein
MFIAEVSAFFSNYIFTVVAKYLMVLLIITTFLHFRYFIFFRSSQILIFLRVCIQHTYPSVIAI